MSYKGGIWRKRPLYMISLAAKERKDKEKDIWHIALAGKCLLIDQLKCDFRVDSQSIVYHNKYTGAIWGIANQVV